MTRSSNNVAFYGIFTALAIILSCFEKSLPSPVASVPGIKLGLANIVVLIFLYTKSERDAFFVNLIRILVIGIGFSGVYGMIYSLSGGIMSFFIMALFKRLNIFSVIGISVLGSVFHNFGQICIAALILQNIKLFLYLPILIILGTAAGALTGFIAGNCLMRLNFERN